MEHFVWSLFAEFLMKTRLYKIIPQRLLWWLADRAPKYNKFRYYFAAYLDPDEIAEDTSDDGFLDYIYEEEFEEEIEEEWLEDELEDELM